MLISVVGFLGAAGIIGGYFMLVRNKKTLGYSAGVVGNITFACYSLLLDAWWGLVLSVVMGGLALVGFITRNAND